MKPKRWQDLTGRQRYAIGALLVVQFALLGAALRDVRRRPEQELRGSRRLWTLAVFVNFVGPVAYFLFGRRPGQQDRIRTKKP
jgi:hypothetical protein